MAETSFEKGIDILRKIEPKINGTVVYCTNIPWKDAMTVLKESTVLVVPSRMESLPQTIKEASYLKIPVIATSVGDIPEVIKNDETGILIPPNDQDKLLDAINNLLVNQEKIEKLTNSAYDFVIKNLTWDVLLPKYVEFYEKLV
ncbi:glycosyltransferase family 4 protein [Candidatus Nitrosotenuis chungbukensis]|uniref:glycosyltransferase n=1 Tax=Candidatus Nitrosotenuis chungbukensis TaxID=1353246 RepID=UPI0026730320|nr:glycosyltransferase family 4 protein [Candidatus Nitrosotenuis chungbukensis]WKT58344.1 glycosyltransferase family 4 protein [Candidatus Nitrosotenuis chungbukensis]